MTFSDFITGIVVPLGTSLATTLITLFISYKSRRRITITSSLSDDKKYHSFYLNDDDFFEETSVASPKTSLKLKFPNDLTKEMRVLELIISNESAKPIHIQQLSILDSESNAVPIAKDYIFRYQNRKPFLNDTVTLVSTDFKNGDTSIWFESINLYSTSPLMIEPYQSKILKYAIPASYDVVDITAYTTMKMNVFSRWILKIRNDLRIKQSKSTVEHYFKAYRSLAIGSKISS